MARSHSYQSLAMSHAHPRYFTFRSLVLASNKVKTKKKVKNWIFPPRQRETGLQRMSYGRGDFGDSASQLGTSPLATGGSSSATMDYQRLTSVVASNTTKIGQNNKEITRLAQDIGTERDGASVRDQLWVNLSMIHNLWLITSFRQQRQQATRKLCKDTERFLKELKALPSPEQESERRQRRVMLTKLANTFSNCLNEFQKAQRESLEKEKMAMKSQSTNEEKNHLINMENT